MLIMHTAFSQDPDRSWRLGLFAGIINYQGDLQPSSFDFERSHIKLSTWVRKNLTNKISLRAGIGQGTLAAADKYNRDYLQPRNLSFKTKIQEAFVSLDFTLFDLTKYKISPFASGDIIMFHFDPFSYDEKGNKIHLQPLSTEGQGLADYPDRKVYKLTQMALGFGGGLRFAVNDNITLSIDASQRKTFTDYIDDVSKSFVDQGKLLAAKGKKAVDMAYRGDEVFNRPPYPNDGEQRGTPTEMDWYYHIGLSAEIKFSAIQNPFSGMSFPRGNSRRGCPRVF